MGIKQGMRVLEVGCGSGFVTRYLSKFRLHKLFTYCW
ncbi:MAG: hypothetical protein ACYCSQ_10020 [bacterium]